MCVYHDFCQSDLGSKNDTDLTGSGSTSLVLYFWSIYGSFIWCNTIDRIRYNVRNRAHTKYIKNAYIKYIDHIRQWYDYDATVYVYSYMSVYLFTLLYVSLNLSATFLLSVSLSYLNLSATYLLSVSQSVCVSFCLSVSLCLSQPLCHFPSLCLSVSFSLFLSVSLLGSILELYQTPCRNLHIVIIRFSISQLFFIMLFLIYFLRILLYLYM